MSQKDTVQNPWAGLSSYEDPAKSSRKLKFCGRESEIFDVTRLIDDNFLVTLYGKSGIGKTSLLNAGVFPALRREQYTPLSLRLGLSEKKQNLQDIITAAVERAVEEAGGSVHVIPVVEEQTDRAANDYLWNWFARRKFMTAEGLTTFPVVVFDQFEEVFRQPGLRAKAEELLAQLHHLMDESNAMGDCIVEGEPYSYDFNFRFVLSIREDDLYRLEDSIDNGALTALKRCRYRLRSLSVQGACDVILIPGEGLFQPEEKNGIVRTIIGMARNKEDKSISTNLLSLVCSRIFVDFQQQSDLRFISQSLVDSFVKSNPFDRFYEEATRGFSNKEKCYIEDHLVDSAGRRNSVPESDFFLHVPQGAKLLEGDARILQRSSVSSDNGNYRMELIHDSFCRPLQLQREKRVKRRRFYMLLVSVGVALLCMGITLFFLYQMERISSQQGTITRQDVDLKLKNDQLKQERDSLSKKEQQLAASLKQIEETNADLENSITELEKERKKAQRALKGMLENHVRFILEKGQALIKDHDRYAARRLAMEILSDDLNHLDKTYVMEAEELLRASMDQDEGILKHKNSVEFVEYSPDGKSVVSASGNEIYIWDVASGCLKGTPLKGHSSEINSVCFSPDGKRVVSCSDDRTARIWDVATGRPVGKALEHGNKVKYASFSPDGKQVVTASWDSIVRVWDVATGRLVMDWGAHNKVVLRAVYSPDGTRIASAGFDLRIWDAKSGKQIGNTINVSEMWCTDISFSPDGKKLVVATYPGFICFVDTETGEKIGSEIRKHWRDVNSVRFSPKGDFVVSAGEDQTVRIWSAETAEQVGCFIGHKDEITFASFSPDGKQIASSSRDGTVRIWSLGKDLVKLNQKTEILRNEKCIALSKDGKKVCVSRGGDWWIVSMKTGQLIVKQTVGNYISAAAFSPDGTKIVLGYLMYNKDDVMERKPLYTIGVWSTETGEQVGKLMEGHADRILSVNFSLDGKQIVSTSEDSSIRVWDITSGSQVGKLLVGHEDKIMSANFSPDGKKMVTASSDVRIWDVATGRQMGESIIGYGAGFDGHFRSATFSSDGKWIVSVCCSGIVYISSAQTGRHVCEIDVYNVKQMDIYNSGSLHNELTVDYAAFTPDDKHVILVTKKGMFIYDFPPLQDLINETRRRYKD